MKPAMRTFHYGDSATQAGDLHLPEGDPRCVVCLLHGGFWKLPYGREQLTAVAQDLAARGHAAWNIGYRRVGEPGGGWPGALDDTVAAISHLARLSREGASLDLRHVVVAGHSAGGQLALLAGAAGACSTVVPLAAASLAGVVDLRRAHALGSGNGAVAALLGGAPEAVPQRYALASPRSRLPLGVRQLVLHGERDDALPAAMAHDYVRAAREAGDDVAFRALPEAGHMDFLDPGSAAHAAFCAWLDALVPPAATAFPIAGRHAE